MGSETYLKWFSKINTQHIYMYINVCMYVTMCICVSIYQLKRYKNIEIKKIPNFYFTFLNNLELIV